MDVLDKDITEASIVPVQSAPVPVDPGIGVLFHQTPSSFLLSSPKDVISRQLYVLNRDANSTNYPPSPSSLLLLGTERLAHLGCHLCSRQASEEQS
jgi:hypothetical protein